MQRETGFQYIWPSCVYILSNRVALPLKSSTTSKILTSFSPYHLENYTLSARSRKFRSISGTLGSRKSFKKSMICRKKLWRRPHGRGRSWSAFKARFSTRAPLIVTDEQKLSTTTIILITPWKKLSEWNIGSDALALPTQSFKNKTLYN